MFSSSLPQCAPPYAQAILDVRRFLRFEIRQNRGVLQAHNKLRRRLSRGEYVVRGKRQPGSTGEIADLVRKWAAFSSEKLRDTNK